MTWTMSPSRKLPEKMTPVKTIIEVVLDCAAKLCHRGIDINMEMAKDMATLAVHHQFNVEHPRRQELTIDEEAGLETLRVTYVDVVTSLIVCHGMGPVMLTLTKDLKTFWVEQHEKLLGFCNDIQDKRTASQSDEETARFWKIVGHEVCGIQALINVHLDNIEKVTKMEEWHQNNKRCPTCVNGLEDLKTDDGCGLPRGAKTIKEGMWAIVSLLYLCHICTVNRGFPLSGWFAACEARARLEPFLSSVDHINKLHDNFSLLNETITELGLYTTVRERNILQDLARDMMRLRVNRVLRKKIPEGKYQFRELMAFETLSGMHSKDANRKGSEWMKKLTEDSHEKGRALFQAITGAVPRRSVENLQG